MAKEKSKSEQKRLQSLAASAFGRLGGNAIAKKRGKGYMSKLGKQGAKARWRKPAPNKGVGAGRS